VIIISQHVIGKINVITVPDYLMFSFAAENQLKYC